MLSKSQHANELGYMILGALTSGALGAIMLQALGALALGILGAIGGYIFNKIGKPKLDKMFDKRDNKAL